MKRCKYCKRKLKPKNGSYVAEAYYDGIYDGGGPSFRYHHIKCEKILNTIEGDIELETALKIMLNKTKD